jgi:EAL domain-containing protein (putative c-di-GMP-specific phosphodiesterase class I)
LVRAQTVIRDFHAIGCEVHLDDFGTGYSSLNYLRVLSVDSIKLDQTFINDIERNPRSAALVRALALLSNSLGHEPIAEGVEWEEQLGVILRLGVSRFQGYLISQPVPMSTVTPEWVDHIEAKLAAHLSAVSSEK